MRLLTFLTKKGEAQRIKCEEDQIFKKLEEEIIHKKCMHLSGYPPINGMASDELVKI